MSPNQQTELKLLEIYDEELLEFVNADNIKNASREGRESSKKFLQDMQHKIEIYEKQISNFKTLFPLSQEVQIYESRPFFFQGILSVLAGIHYDLYSSLFSPSKWGKLTEAIKLFEKSLEINESAKTRNMIVFCYRQLGDKKRALQEIDNILRLYIDDEEVYLLARKEKADLEA